MRRFDITAAGDISYSDDGACVWFRETQEGEANDSLRAELVEARRQLTAYQIAKDNLELRLASFLQLISQAGSSIDDHVLQVKLGAFEWRQGMPTTSSRSQVY